MFGCLRSLITLAVIAVLCVVGWFYRDRLERAWNDLRGGGAGAEAGAVAVTPADYAASANRKLASIEDGPPPAQIVLSSAELQSTLKSRFATMLPGYVDSAKIELKDGKVRLSARVPTKDLPDLSSLKQIAALLPDTTDIAVTGQIIPLGEGRAAIGVDGISAARIPLPHKLVPEVLARMRRKQEPGLPADAIAFPLPPGASTAYVRGDSLVILARGARVPAESPR